MPKPPITLDIKVETKKLNRKLKDLARYQKKPLWEVVENGVVAYTQSVVKETPPKPGAMKKRTVIELRKEEYDARHGVMHSKGKERYKVPYRTARKKGRKYFGKKSLAKKFAKIVYRKLGKYSWLAAAQKAIAKIIPVKRLNVSQEVKRKADQITSGKRRKGIFSIAMLHTKVKSIGKYGIYASLLALRKANRKMKAATREYKKKLKQRWQ